MEKLEQLILEICPEEKGKLSSFKEYLNPNSWYGTITRVYFTQIEDDEEMLDICLDECGIDTDISVLKRRELVEVIKELRTTFS